MKKILSSFLIGLIVLGPTVVFAQTTACLDGTIVPRGTRCPDSDTTTDVLGHFNPAVTTVGGGGNSFDGLNFSGVGGAIIGCSNIGESITGGVSDLFKKSSDKAKEDAADSGGTVGSLVRAAAGMDGKAGSTEEQPVTDAKATAQLKKQTQRENCLNGVAYAVAKNLLQQISNRTLNWINTGLNGNPFYVRNIDSYLLTIKNDKIRTFLDNVPTNDPVFGNALRSVITQQVTGKSDGLLSKAMDTPEARAYQNFQNDFTQGGWTAFLNSNNNAIGAFFKATDKLADQVSTAEQNTKDELAQGQGFLSMKKCVEYQTVIGSTPICLREETVTPGSVIAAQASTVTTSSLRQLEAADSINEVLGSFFDQLLNRLFSTGLGGLSGAGNGSGNNVVFDSQGNQIQSINQGAADAAFGYQSINGGFNGEFDISRPQQLRAIIKTQLNFINATKDSQIIMSRIIPTLGELDYCVPGPNPTWKLGTDYNTQLFLSALAGKAPSQALGNTISTISSIGSALPGPGTVIAAVGNVVGGLVNLFGGSTPVSVSATSLQLFDKVTNRGQELSDFKLNRKRFFDDIPLIEYLGTGYQSLMDNYTKAFDPKIVHDAFIAANPGTSSAFNEGRISDIIDETTNLIYYNQSITEFNKQNVEGISEAEDAVSKLNAIRERSEVIVARAKDRYIKEMKAKGTPVDVNVVLNQETGRPVIDPVTRKSLLCIDQAYNVTRDPTRGTATPLPLKAISGRERQAPEQTPTAAAKIQRSNEASVYFYSHL